MTAATGEGLSFVRSSWAGRAAALADIFPRPRLHSAALSWVEEAPPGAMQGVACSAGADSIALLLLLWAHFPLRRGEWKVLHFNHRLRGAESDRESEFIEEVASALGMEFKKGEWWEPRPGEAAARQARFAFFEQALTGKPKGGLFFGHQCDDIAESLLMRISRGSGAGGLAAPRPVHLFPGGRTHLRPLLTLGATEIRETLGRLDIPFCEDPSNREAIYFRNRIRHCVLPRWREVSPSDPCEGAARTREQLEEDDEALLSWLYELLPVPPRPERFSVAILRGRPRALLRRALYRWLIVCERLESLSKGAFDHLLNSVEAGKSIKISAGVGAWILFDGKELSLRIKQSPIPWRVSEGQLPLGATLFLPGGGEIRARWVGWSEGHQRELEAGEFDPVITVFLSPESVFTGPLIVRRWRAGDRYRPLGAPGRRKLQDIFTDRKVDIEERIRLPLVCLSTGPIAWCPGLPPADFLKIKDQPKQVVQLTYDFSQPV